MTLDRITTDISHTSGHSIPPRHGGGVWRITFHLKHQRLNCERFWNHYQGVISKPRPPPDPPRPLTPFMPYGQPLNTGHVWKWYDTFLNHRKLQQINTTYHDFYIWNNWYYTIQSMDWPFKSPPPRLVLSLVRPL